MSFFYIKYFTRELNGKGWGEDAIAAAVGYCFSLHSAFNVKSSANQSATISPIQLGCPHMPLGVLRATTSLQRTLCFIKYWGFFINFHKVVENKQKEGRKFWTRVAYTSRFLTPDSQSEMFDIIEWRINIIQLLYVFSPQRSDYIMYYVYFYLS